MPSGLTAVPGTNPGYSMGRLIAFVPYPVTFAPSACCTAYVSTVN